VNGLAIGIVKENSDDKHPGMLKVTLPVYDSKGDETFWAIVATPYGGKDYGIYFLPEVGDAVVVGFIGGDSQTPVVLGCFWNSVNTFPPETVNKENEKKVLITKGGHSILIREGKEGGLTIKTKAGHEVSLSDKDKKITVSTNNGKNKVVLDEDKSLIAVESGDKLSIKAKDISIEGKISMKGSAISLAADGELSLKGKTGKMEGNTFKISGQSLEIAGSVLKVESSGPLTLKGALTKIN